MKFFRGPKLILKDCKYKTYSLNYSVNITTRIDEIMNVLPLQIDMCT